MSLPDSDPEELLKDIHAPAPAASAAHGSSKPGRSRLCRRDQATCQQGSGTDLDELADMMQGFDLSGKGSSRGSSAACAAAQSASSAACNSSSSGSQASHQQQHKQVVDLSTTSHGTGSDAADGTIEQVEDASSSNDEEPLAYVPRGRKPPATAAAMRTPATPAVPSESESDEDDDDGDYYKRAATRFVDAEAAESAAEEDSGDETEATGEEEDDEDASGSSNCSSHGRQQQQQAVKAAAEASAGGLVLEGGFCLDAKVASKLYPHQVEGVKWLWSLHR